MIRKGPRYSGEEAERRGQEIYERDILPLLHPDDKGKFVAIDIETGLYEIDPKDMIAVNRLYARRADAHPWLLRVGYRATVHFGGFREEV